MKKNLSTLALITATCGMCLVLMYASARAEAQSPPPSNVGAQAADDIDSLKARISALQRQVDDLTVKLAQKRLDFDQCDATAAQREGQDALRHSQMQQQAEKDAATPKAPEVAKVPAKPAEKQ